MSTKNIFTLNRRNFLGYITLGTLGLLTKDLLYPASARADSNTADKPVNIKERYHIYVPFTIARNGGTQTVMLRSGELCQVDIPAKIQDNHEMNIPGRGENGKDIYVVLHTLYDQKTQIADRIYQEIDSTKFFQASSKAKCKSVYDQVEDGEYIDDLSNLDFLDYVISSSQIDNTIKERYQLASINSRLLGIQQAIESSLAKSQLTEAEKNLIRGTFAYVRAGEPIPNFKALTDLDSIVTSSTLPLEIKQTYSFASATSRGLTVDFIIVKEIKESQQLTDVEKNNYLLTYQELRDGKTVKDTANLKLLNTFISSNANILDNAKAVYSLVNQQNLDNQDALAQQADALQQIAQQFKEQLKDAKNKGSVIVPQATKLLSTLGVETATGVSISSLSGAAATNATLAFLGGGSVAAGGFGMLGGLAVATGGAALIGAAGIISIALVSEMDSEDQKNLGIAIGAGTLTSVATVLAAWTAASALGVSGTLSGAAAITAIISALGGLSVITGGAALVASGAAFVIWSLLQNSKTRDASLLKQLETRSYTYTEAQTTGNLGEFIANSVSAIYKFKEGFSAPNIPLDKLYNALNQRVSIDSDEKVISLIYIPYWFSSDDIVFTERRIASKNNSINYKYLGEFVKKDTKLASLLSDNNQRQELSNLKKVVDILSDSEYSTNVSKIQELANLTSKDKKLAEIVSNETYRNKVYYLKKAVDILSNDKASQNLLKLQEVINIWSNYLELIQFFPSPLVTHLYYNHQYQQELSTLQEVIKMLYNEDDQYNFTNMLREIGKQYSKV